MANLQIPCIMGLADIPLPIGFGYKMTFTLPNFAVTCKASRYNEVDSGPGEWTSDRSHKHAFGSHRKLHSDNSSMPGKL